MTPKLNVTVRQERAASATDVRMHGFAQRIEVPAVSSTTRADGAVQAFGDLLQSEGTRAELRRLGFRVDAATTEGRYRFAGKRR